jgi:AcrR family transcriptional regulator
MAWNDIAAMTLNDSKVIKDPMPDNEPKWRRRKEARPGEIVDAALSVFAESGFAAARLEDIARRAGVAKSSLYLYFETKEELFRAVVHSAISPNIGAIKTAAEAFDGPFKELAPMLLYRAALSMTSSHVPAVAKMVIGESRNFPDLARIWHDDVVSQVLAILSAIIARGQARGEVKAGDPRLYAFSLVGPLLMGVLFREVFAGVALDLPDLQALAAQHARAVLEGLLSQQT